MSPEGLDTPFMLEGAEEITGDDRRQLALCLIGELLDPYIRPHFARVYTHPENVHGIKRFAGTFVPYTNEDTPEAEHPAHLVGEQHTSSVLGGAFADFQDATQLSVPPGLTIPLDWRGRIFELVEIEIPDLSTLTVPGDQYDTT